MYCGYASLCKARTLLVELHLPQRERPLVGKATRDLGRIPKWRVQGSQFAMTYFDIFDMSSQKSLESWVEPHQEFLMQPAANSIPKEFDYVLTGLVHNLTILLAIHYHDLTIARPEHIWKCHPQSSKGQITITIDLQRDCIQQRGRKSCRFPEC